MSQFGTNHPLLDARLEGGKYTATANSITEHHFIFAGDCVFNGIEIFAKDSNFDDDIELYTEYYVPPLNEWKRYKKFGKKFNLAPNTLQKYVLLPAEPSAGVRVTIKYNNTGSTDVKFFANYYVFTDLAEVNPAQLQEGEDW